MKTGRAALQPPAVFDVEASAKPSDSDRQGNGRKGAGAEENDKDDLILGNEDEAGGEGRDEAIEAKRRFFRVNRNSSDRGPAD